MDTTRSINGEQTSREQLRQYTIADRRILTIVERARRRGEPGGE